MTQAELVDIAIGVVFTFFVLSLVVSAINEAINRSLSVRSKQLWRALRRMLDDSLTDAGSGDNRSGLWANLWQSVTYGGRPTGAHQVAPAGGAQSVTHKVTDRFYASSTIQSMEVLTDSATMTKIHHIPPPVFTQGMLETIGDWGDAATKAARAGLSAYDATRRSVEDFLEDPAVPEGVRRQVRVHWAAANGDIKRFGDELGCWFDSQMTRLSAVYKSQARITLGFIGLVVVVAGFVLGLRTDSLALLTDLQHDENLRTVLTSAASSAVQNDLAHLGCPSPDQGSAPAQAPPGTTTTTPATTTPITECQLRGLISTKKFDLAFRRRPRAAMSEYAPGPDDSPPARLRFLLTHRRALLGVVITTLAIAFGSSFWYSILQRLVGLRGGGNTTPQPT